MTITTRAPEPDTSNFVLLPLAASPRHEPEVQQQLGDQSSEGSAAHDAMEFALAGIRAGLRVQGLPAHVRELLQQWEQQGLRVLR